jgi:hypothetical protein
VARAVLPAAKKLGKQVADLPPRLPKPKPSAGSSKLQNIVDDIWKHAGRPGSKGDGTTFDALRNEIRTGKPSAGKFHYQKAADLMSGLQKVIADPATSAADRQLARDLLEQFSDAWKGRP